MYQVYRITPPLMCCTQLWHAVGGREFFKTQACHDMLKEHSVEVRGVTLPNFVGDRVFNGIFAEGGSLDPLSVNTI